MLKLCLFAVYVNNLTAYHNCFASILRYIGHSSKWNKVSTLPFMSMVCQSYFITNVYATVHGWIFLTKVIFLVNCDIKNAVI